MQNLLNQMRFQAGIGQNAIAGTRCAIVKSYNPVDCTVQVSIQPEDEEFPEGSLTGWIPLSTSYIGAVGAPNIDDQVVVAFQEGSINSGIVIGRLYSSVDVPPNVPAGEWWVTHPSGSMIKLKTNGDVEIMAANELNIISDLKVNVAAPEIELDDGGTPLKLVTESMVNFFNTHTHSGGAVPDQTMGDGQLTEVVKGE